jgi:hypothetical protein
MYCINLVHSQIDIFDSNHWIPQDKIELHNKLKDKMQLINDALCMATKWKESKLPNITRFKLPFQPCTRQGHKNDDAFFCVEEHLVLEWRRMDTMDRRGNHLKICHIIALFYSILLCLQH